MHKYRHSFSRSFARVASSIVAIASILLPALLVPPALAQNAGPWEDLVNNIVGFGKNTTGGKGGELCQVTNLNDSGAGSLRACAEAVGPKWITFTVSGTITLTSEILIKSNKTIDGRGQDITIANRGFTIGTWNTVNPASNVIIHNISIKNVNGNAMVLIAEDASNIWVDHVTFKTPIDETVYIGSNGSNGPVRAAPHSITLSWNRWIKAGLNPEEGGSSYERAILISDPSLPVDVAITVTLHHNHYDRTYVRHPLARYAKVHSFNNYYHKTVHTVQVSSNGRFYSENEIFERVSNYPMVKVDPFAGTTYVEGPAANVKVVNPWLINGATVEERNPTSIFNPSSYYSYIAETANAALQTKIINTAGWQNVASPISSSIEDADQGSRPG